MQQADVLFDICIHMYKKLVWNSCYVYLYVFVCVCLCVCVFVYVWV